MHAEPGLDAEELLQLALRATRRNDAAQALGYVERALQLTPADARLHLLAGGLLTEAGQIEPALAAFERAVALDRGLWGAHFQLGLLYSTSGRLDDARRAWAPLDALEPGHPLRHFKAGLEALEAGDDASCLEQLDAGIAANHDSEALNANMRLVTAKVRERR